MTGLPTLFLLASASLMAPQPPAQGTGDVVVRAPERLVCRPVNRAGTRIGSNGVCRTRAEWETWRGRAGDGGYYSVDDAAAKLAVIGDSCTPGPQGCD